MRNKTVFIFGDLHLPYERRDLVSKAIELVRAMKPYYIVQIGDLYDFWHFSRYPKSMLAFDGETEVRKGRERAEAFWRDVLKASKRSKAFQIKGNHDERPQKRLLDRCPELEPFLAPGYGSLFQFKGVETVLSSREELSLKTCQGQVLFHHGHRGRLGDHMVYNQQSTVVGHSHVGGVVYKQYGDQTRWELNVGYLGDPKQGPLQYGEQSRKYWTHGIGIIDTLGPRFVSLNRRKI